MKCPHCSEVFTASLCPNCMKPVRVRSGLIIPDSDTLLEIPYAQGQKYARSYRIALLRPEEDKPLKICLGCEEKPLEFMVGKKSWFNPVIISPEKIPLLKDMTFAQMASQIAYESYCKKVKTPSSFLTSNVARYVEARNSGELERLAIRFIKIMEG